MHGDFLVGLCTEERIGRKQASCLVIARPNTKPEELDHLEATFTDDAVKIIGPARGNAFLEQSQKWMGALEANKDLFEAEKLCQTLKTMVTKMKKQQQLKTTVLSVKKLGWEILNEHFNKGACGESLNMIPIPYDYSKRVGSKNNHITEVICIWRAYIVGTEDEIEEESHQSSTNKSNFDMMLSMMAGCKMNP